MSSQTQFIKKIAPYIQKYAKKHGYPYASPIIAQACLESGFGTSELAVNALNFFGLKYTTASRVPSADGYYIKVGSEQNADGSYTSSVMQWCKFNTMEDCVKGYFEFLNNGYGRYTNLKSATSPTNYLELIKKDGYASSLAYYNKTTALLSQYNLTDYDEGNNNKTVYYVVNCGSYSTMANANSQCAKLSTKGFSAYIKKIDKLYKVRVGRYNNKSLADNKAKQIKAKGIDCFITTDTD